MNSAEFRIGHIRTVGVWYSILHLHCTAAHRRKKLGNGMMDRAKGYIQICVANEGDMGGTVTYNKRPSPILISLDHLLVVWCIRYETLCVTISPAVLSLCVIEAVIKWQLV